MATYYNRQKTPLNLPLRSGRSASVSPKSYVELTAEEEGSERVVRYRLKGWLVRMRDSEPAPEPITEMPAPLTEPEVKEPTPEPAKETKAEAESEAEKESGSDPDESTTRRSRRRKRGSGA